MVELRNVSKTYLEGGRPHTVLDGIDLTVDEGEVVALIGRSGSGKSTLLNLIAGIDAPDQGEVVVAGKPIGELSDRDRTLFRRAQIGFVYQFFNLIPTLTVLENVLLPLELLGRSRREARKTSMDMLDRVELGDRGGAFPDRLSGGEQQRVAIARALAPEPLLVLADEPTGNLDADTGSRVLDLLGGLTRDRGKTLIMVTHSTQVGDMADRVLEIHSS